MERSTAYSWSSVRNFRSSLNNAVEGGRISWEDRDVIRDRSQIFFTHSDLRSQNRGTQRTQTTKRDTCRDWNYSGKCSFPITEASYKNTHRCRVCESLEHPMLRCPKRKFSIPGFTKVDNEQPST